MTDNFDPKDFVNGASFFGFMGVSMALVLASKPINMKTWVLLMEQLRQEPASVALLFGNLQLL